MHDWMMDNWGMGLGMGLGFIFWLTLLVLIVAALVWLIRSQTTARDSAEQRSSGRDTLDERYARGEINREEYLQKKHDLDG